MNHAHRPDAAFWRGKKVLLTGHTGFKGSWLSLWLNRLGAQVVGYSLAPITQPNLFGLIRGAELVESRIGDTCAPVPVAAAVEAAQPEIVFHLAAQSLVHEGYREPLATFATNVQGTAIVLDALRGVKSVKAVVAVTSDKVCQNLEHVFPYRETDALGGHDPYSASKAASEIVIAAYRASYLAAQGVAVASARAGNVIGGGDWSADRLIPDAVRAWSTGRPLTIRRPAAIRPWQHVLAPLAGYVRLAEHLWTHADAAGSYNFGPAADAAANVHEVISLARAAYGEGEVAFGGDDEWQHEAHWLALETAKSRHLLAVRPRWSLADGVQRTMAWYRGHADGHDARALCIADIDAFEAQPS